MHDEKIIELFFARDEQAIRESITAYGNYCRSIAGGILPDPSDAEEAVADTWLAAWDAIPPQRPKYLKLFLGRITRNRAVSIWRRNNARCRGLGQVSLALEELGECVSPETTPEQAVDRAVAAFLKLEPAARRCVFLRRYFYLEDVAQIANRYGLQTANVRMMLSRTRQKLKKYLKEGGYLL